MKSFIVLTLVLCAVVNCASLNLGRIVGGREAKVGEAPYIVQLKLDETSLCSGALILPTWVITAGHCLFREGLKVYAGLHAVNGYSDPEVQVRTISSANHYIVHPFYSAALDSVDLGLIYIAKPFDVQKSARVKTIALATGKYEQSTTGKFYGWGKMEGGVFPTNLRVLDVNIQNYEQCWDLFEYSVPLMSYNVCTEGPYGPCHLDSGGPLIHDTPEGLELVGISSWAKLPCEKRTTPAVYMNVSAFHEWILDAIGEFVSQLH